MSFGLGSLLMLAGLAGMAIPILIHLLHRRRQDVVDWGAMQFLQVSQATRRRLLLEEIFLLVVRMGLVGLMVLALAAPYASGPLVAGLGEQAGRDVVLVLDGSASMGLDDGQTPTPQAAAQAWAGKFLDTLDAGDDVALLVAQQQVLPVLAELTHDLELVRAKIDRLPRPHGGCDGPRAVQEARRLLAAKGRQQNREIIVLTDGQRHGWADAASLFAWERLAAGLRPAEEGEGADPAPPPRVWIVNVGRDHKPSEAIPNYALLPLRALRGVAWVGQRLTLRTAIALTGQAAYQPPYRIRLEADGKEVGALEAPAKAALVNGQVPLAFRHRFTTPGVHLLSVILEPDPPARLRHAQTPLRDHLAEDNRQDLAVEVVASLPVLLVDGDNVLSPESSTWFLRKALSQRPATVLAQAAPARTFDPALLVQDVDPQTPGSRPRVLVLADVADLTPGQQQAIERFLSAGGSVLVAPGERVARTLKFYNEQLYRGGQGWLPARLEQVGGNLRGPEQATSIDLKLSHHPALEMFRGEPAGALDQARLPRWWIVGTDGKGTAAVGALLATGDPLLVEKAYGKGKVLLWTATLDRSWGSGLPGTWEFPVLVHELIYHLADTRSADFNLQPGQPLRYEPAPLPKGPGKAPGPAEKVVLFPPDGAPRLLPAHWPLVYEEARATGVYKLQVGQSRPTWFVAQPDPRESDLTFCQDEDRARLAGRAPVHFENDLEAVTAAMQGPARSADLWWLVMVAVMALLCGEVWLTRRMALKA